MITPIFTFTEYQTTHKSKSKSCNENDIFIKNSIPCTSYILSALIADLNVITIKLSMNNALTAVSYYNHPDQTLSTLLKEYL